MNNENVVLVTDFAWPSIEVEREIFRAAGIRLIIAESGSEKELVCLAPVASGILCNWKTVSAAVLRVAEKCIAVGRYGIGLDNIDVEEATRLGIVVTNVPDYCVDDVADHTMALLFACNRKVCWFDRDIKTGKYDLKAQLPLRRLRSQTLGIAGFGRIGQAVFERASATGLRVIALCPRGSSILPTHKGVEFVSWPDLLRQSDYLSIHLPATPNTVGLFDSRAFEQMKDGVVLINTARGSIVRSEDLLRALGTGKVSAAGIDVWQSEPLPFDDPLANHPRVIATPHAAFYSDQALFELQNAAASQMAFILTGQEPQNVVNRTVLSASNLRARIFPTQEFRTVS